jgi:hypothetical protein
VFPVGLREGLSTFILHYATHLHFTFDSCDLFEPCGFSSAVRCARGREPRGYVYTFERMVCMSTESGPRVDTGTDRQPGVPQLDPAEVWRCCAFLAIDFPTNGRVWGFHTHALYMALLIGSGATPREFNIYSFLHGHLLIPGRASRGCHKF